MTVSPHAPAATRAPAIGEYWPGQGGIYAGVMPDYVGTEPKHLIFSQDEAVDVKWSADARVEPGAQSPYDGASIRAGLERAIALGVPNPAGRSVAAEHDLSVQVARIEAVLQRVAS